MATAGSIVVDLLMRTGSFETDGKRAEKTLKNLEFSVEKWALRAGGAVITVGAAFATWAVKVSQSGAQIERFAQISNTSTDAFQRMAYGAKTYGIEQEKLADQLKDFTEKTGEYIQSGGGGMKDFFENIAPAVGVTAEQFRRLSGAEGLQLYYDSLEKAGLSQKEMSFYLESMASDTTALIPLLKNGGAELRSLGDEAERFGAIMDDSAIRASREFDQNLDRLQSMAAGVSVTFANQTLPVLNEFIDLAFEAAVETDGILTSARALAKDRSLPYWIDSVGHGLAIVADGAVVLVRTLNTVTLSFRTVVADVRKALASIAQDQTGLSSILAPEEARRRLAEYESVVNERNDIVARANDALGDLWSYEGNKFEQSWLKAVDKTNFDRNFVGPLAPVVVEGGGGRDRIGGGKPTKATQLDEGARYIQQLNERIALIGKETELEQLLARVSAGTLKFKTPEMEKQAVEQAKLLDLKTKEYDLEKVLGDLRLQQSTTQIQFMRDLESFGQGDRVRELNDDLAKVEDRYRSLIEARRNSAQGLSDADLVQIKASLDKELSMVREYHDKKLAIQQDWGLGARDALINYADEAANVYSSVGNLATSMFKGMEDSIVQFVRTGKLSFADLADSIISDMVRIMVQQSITGPLAGALSAGIGSMFSAGATGLASATAADVAAAGPGLMFLSSGGYTGDGGKYQPAGIVHRGEGVLNQDEIRSIGGESGFNALRRAIRLGHSSGGMGGYPRLPPVTPMAQQNQQPSIVINSTVNAAPGTNAAELDALLEQRNEELRYQIYEDMRRGRVNV